MRVTSFTHLAPHFLIILITFTKEQNLRSYAWCTFLHLCVILSPFGALQHQNMLYWHNTADTVRGLVGCIINFKFVVRVGPSGRLGLGRLVTGIVGLNPARGMDACVCVSVLCCPVQVETLRRGDRSSKKSYQMSLIHKVQKNVILNWNTL
jgi:hypothetical protein